MEDAIVANKRLVEEEVMDWHSEERAYHIHIAGTRTRSGRYSKTDSKKPSRVFSIKTMACVNRGGLIRKGHWPFFRDPESGRTIPLLVRG